MDIERPASLREGDRFESGILHQKLQVILKLFLLFLAGNFNRKLALNNQFEIIYRYSYLSSFWLFVYASAK